MSDESRDSMPVTAASRAARNPHVSQFKSAEDVLRREIDELKAEVQRLKDELLKIKESLLDHYCQACNDRAAWATAELENGHKSTLDVPRTPIIPGKQDEDRVREFYPNAAIRYTTLESGNKDFCVIDCSSGECREISRIMSTREEAWHSAVVLLTRPTSVSHESLAWKDAARGTP